MLSDVAADIHARPIVGRKAAGRRDDDGRAASYRRRLLPTLHSHDHGDSRRAGRHHVSSSDVTAERAKYYHFRLIMPIIIIDRPHCICRFDAMMSAKIGPYPRRL